MHKYTFLLCSCPVHVSFLCVMSVIHENKAFSACFIVWRCNYTSSYIKVDLCAHTYGKIGTFTAEYILATF